MIFFACAFSMDHQIKYAFLSAFLRTEEVFAILVGGVFCSEEVSLAKSSQIDCPSFCPSGHPLILLLLLTSAARLVF